MPTLIVEALKLEESHDSLEICGWIRTRRDAKEFTFLEINDGSSLKNMQCIVDAGTLAFQNLGHAQTGSSVKIKGSLVASLGKGQKWEIQVKELEVLGLADPEFYPLQKKRHSDEFLRTIAHLRPRTNKYGALFRLRSEAAFSIHKFFHQEHFHYVHTPILTSSDCEGAGEMFRVTSLPPGETDLSQDFFTKKASLTVSGQLEAEALALSLGRVYTFGPTFRAENSNTPRHVAEFWMIEPEMAFADLKDIMLLGERLLKAVTTDLLATHTQDLELFDKFVAKGLIAKLEALAKSDHFKHLSYHESLVILQKSGKSFNYEPLDGQDLQTEHERYLAEEYCQGPVIIYDYPRSLKPFYMRDNQDQKTVAAMDILLPGIGEIIGGSEREERLDVLQAKMAEQGQKIDDYWWYLDLRRFGSVPHAGFGLGFERLLMWLSGLSNIRDCIPFPRTPGNLEF
ncbi:MAG: asparagine--tRNA ligase [Desulfovibrionaceae bacterium]|nr:asparagine--tRNA ligase [Desulfovibrionaceae bacterium]